MYCMQCGQSLPDEAQSCIQCQAPIPGRESITHEQELAALIGPNNQQWYLQRFTQLAQGGSSLGWHWPALFFPFFWLLYRKMWLIALIYLIAPMLAVFLMRPIEISATHINPLLGSLIPLGTGLLIKLLPPLLATRLYYHHCMRKLARLQQQEPDSRQRLARLHASGGTSSIVLVVLPLLLIAILGILAAIALPAYQEYTLRAKLQMALSEAQGITQQLDSYYQSHHQLPDSLNTIGYQPVAASGLEKLDYDAEQGLLLVTPHFNNVQVGALRLSAREENGQLRWQCEGIDVRPKLLPPSCR